MIARIPPAKSDAVDFFFGCGIGVGSGAVVSFGVPVGSGAAVSVGVSVGSAVCVGSVVGVGLSVGSGAVVGIGVPVGSAAESERVLKDFRRVVGELFAENYAGALAKKCHQYGLKLSLEPYGSGPFDNLQYGRNCDIPVAEFWSHGQHRNDDCGNYNHANYTDYNSFCTFLFCHKNQLIYNNEGGKYNPPEKTLY